MFVMEEAAMEQEHLVKKRTGKRGQKKKKPTNVKIGNATLTLLQRSGNYGISVSARQTTRS